MKFKPKKTLRKTKKHIKKEDKESKEIKNEYDVYNTLINNFEEIETPRRNEGLSDKSIHEIFNNKKQIELKDFQQMTEPEKKSFKRSKVKDEAVETSIEEKPHIINKCNNIESEDKNTSCDILKSQKPTYINVETITSEIYIQPEDNKLEDSEAEVDFRLTSSREMDSKFRSLFNTDNIQKSNRVNDKISEELSDRYIEPEIETPLIKKNLIKDYTDDMECALKQREKDEKSKLKSLLKNKRISDRSYKQKREFIEKWVEAERKQIKSTKNILIQGWMKANEIINHLEKDK